MSIVRDAFRETARTLMRTWANDHGRLQGADSFKRFVEIQQSTRNAAGRQPRRLRQALLDFIADFANWDNSTVREYLDTSRALTQAAHEALGGAPGTRPLVVDPFAGGGSIPLEALRVGADAFASDLNPVAVLLNKVVLEYIPKYGQRLADEVRKWGEWIKREAEKELAEFYPKDADGATPIAYLWARTIHCEGPGCGAEVPLIRSLWLAKKANRSIALQLVPNPKAKRVDFQITVKHRDGWVDQANPKITIANPKFDGTVKRGSATCPCCGYTTPVARVREQLKARRGGASDARLYSVVLTHPTEAGRFYRLPMQKDMSAVEKAASVLKQRKSEHHGPLSLVPEEKLDLRGIRHTWGMIYGFDNWESFFSLRQLVALVTLTRLVREVADKEFADADLTNAVATCLALTIDKVADLANSVCRWEPVAECPRQLFARQAIPITWDFAEGVPTGKSSGSWSILIDRFEKVLSDIGSDWHTSSPQQSTATAHPMPDDSANAFITDPPYYDAVPYAFLRISSTFGFVEVLAISTATSSKNQLFRRTRRLSLTVRMS